jgi:hypothetical protein
VLKMILKDPATLATAFTQDRNNQAMAAARVHGGQPATLSN